MRQVFFHIGAHKTGTTYVQDTASKMEGALDDAGLRYLRAGREMLGHHSLPRAVLLGSERTDLAERIQEELAETPNDILVSSENLEHIEESQIERVVALFPDCEPRALFVFRNWGSLLYASWQEDIKHGGAQSFAEFCLPHIAQPDESAVLNFRIPIGRWANVLGRSRVSVASYEAVCAMENLCAFVMRWAGVRSAMNFPESKMNTSYDPFAVETIRALNQMAAACGYNPDPRVRTRYFDTALKHADSRHADVLRKHMEKYAKLTPDLGSSPASVQYFDAFLREYEPMLIDAPEARASIVSASREGQMTIDPTYLWAPEARAALMHYWLLLMPELRQPLVS